MQLLIALILCVGLEFSIAFPDSIPPTERPNNELDKIADLAQSISVCNEKIDVVLEILMNSLKGDSKNLLLNAMDIGEGKLAEYLIKRGANVHVEDEISGKTPLHAAVTAGHPKLVDLLLKNGANVNNTDSFGNTPLHLASYNGNVEIASTLIETGAYLDARTDQGHTPLFQAVDREQKDNVELLLKNGAIATIGNYDEVTPLHIAVQKDGDDPTIPALLIKNGAEVNSKTYTNETPLGLTSLDNMKTVKLLLENGANVNETLVTRKFVYAIRSGNEEVFDLFINRGINTNSEYYGETPLTAASNAGSVRMARDLILNGADIYIPNANGYTILHIAAHRGNLELMDLALEISAGNTRITDANDEKNGTVSENHTKSEVKNRRLINLKSNEGETALHMIAMKYDTGDDDLAILEKLIENCAHLDVQDRRLRTSLHHAATEGKTKFVEVLVKNGANRSLTDMNHNLPGTFVYRYGTRSDFSELSNLLSPNYTAGTDDRGCLAFHTAVERGNISLVRNLTETHDIDGVDEFGNTPLLIAVNNGNKEMVEFLIKGGANVNLNDFRGNSPLSIAAEKCYPEIAEMLVKSGADIESKNLISRTPYSTASSKHCNKVAEMLMKNGANVDVTVHESST